MHNANNKFYIKTWGKNEKKCYLETKGQICEKRAIHYLHIKINIIGKAINTGKQEKEIPTCGFQCNHPRV
jgi:hypothetical protein